MNQKPLHEDLLWKERQAATDKTTMSIFCTAQPLIAKFTEGRTPDLRRWLEEYADTMYRLDAKSEVGNRLLPLFLQGTARERYKALTEEQRRDWKSSVENLMRAFDFVGDREVTHEELATLTQGHLSINEFARKIRTLGAYAYEKMDLATRESLMASHFLHNSGPELKYRLLELDPRPKTLDEMVRKAERFQRLQDLREADSRHNEDLIAAFRNINMRAADRFSDNDEEEDYSDFEDEQEYYEDGSDEYDEEDDYSDFEDEEDDYEDERDEYDEEDEDSEHEIQLEDLVAAIMDIRMEDLVRRSHEEEENAEQNDVEAEREEHDDEEEHQEAEDEEYEGDAYCLAKFLTR